MRQVEWVGGQVVEAMWTEGLNFLEVVLVGVDRILVVVGCSLTGRVECGWRIG